MERFLYLVSLFTILGFVLTVCSFMGWISPALFFLVFAAMVCGMLLFIPRVMHFLPKLSPWEKYLVYGLFVIWGLHFLQVLVPETGFDAVWYHLPVVSHIISTGRIEYVPELYQTMNPLFADMYFMAGFAVFGTTGAKVVAYMFGVLLAAATYYVSRFFLRRHLSLLVVATVSLFQVVAWQSSSFYVDVAKAFFEVTAILAILYAHKKSSRFLLLAALFFSASLATKMFSFLLLPIIIVVLWYEWRRCGLRVSYLVVLMGALFVLALPYYLGAWWYTGNPIFSFVVPITILGEIGGNASPAGYLISRAISSPMFLVRLLLSRDYVSPLSVAFLFPILLRIKDILNEYSLKIIFVFSVFQVALWWFVPPFSTRYALSGFITLFLLGVIIVDRYFIYSKKQRKIFLLVLGLQVVILLIPRLIVAQRSLTYILTNQTEAEYVRQFYDGTIDDKLEAWYFSEK